MKRKQIITYGNVVTNYIGQGDNENEQGSLPPPNVEINEEEEMTEEELKELQKQADEAGSLLPSELNRGAGFSTSILDPNYCEDCD